MAECPEDIKEFLNFDLPTFTANSDCQGLYAAIAIAEAHLIRVTLDPCAFDELEFAGVRCSGAEKITRITSLIKCWQELIKCKTATQHVHQRRPARKKCSGRCKPKGNCGTRFKA